MADQAAERREVFYSGMVQGIGFRYTVRMLASPLALTGFVRNLPDGRVQLVAEGSKDQVQGLLDAVEAEMGRYIRDVKVNSRPTTGEFSDFEIRF
ncbi:MAG: acylphosphatase [Pirellulales bacterium]|nr:acylphosphatase [Pirellulales bacterium]